jgi:hypothetical protein
MMFQCKTLSMGNTTNIHTIIDEFLDSIAEEDLHRVNEFLANLPRHPNNLNNQENMI